MPARFPVPAAALAAAALLAAAPGLAVETVVLDAGDIADWVHVTHSAGWKHHDACLAPNALVRFDLGDVGAVDEILDARLHLYWERAEPGVTIQLWHVQDDAWSYGRSASDVLWSWPTWHAIGTVARNDTGPVSVDVTAHLREEHQAADQTFSIKLTAVGEAFLARLGSPQAPLQHMRPRLVVQYRPLPSVAPRPPDLALSTADIRMAPMRPGPGQAVQLSAEVRKISGASSWAGSC